MNEASKLYPVGSYVTYKDVVHMVIGYAGLSLVKIFNPLGCNLKLSVKSSNIQPTNYRPAAIVTHKFRQYIVTAKGMIIHRATGNVMKWAETNGDRKAILELAAQ